MATRRKFRVWCGTSYTVVSAKDWETAKTKLSTEWLLRMDRVVEFA
jgi:hypothetical protein